MMTIADIYDALVAIDRPYKNPISDEEGARRSSRGRHAQGRDRLRYAQVFIDAKVYDDPDFKAQLRPKS